MKRKGQKKRAAKAKPVESITTKVGLRRKFCASQTTVDKWCARPDFPGGSKGPWNAEAVAAWLELIESPLAPRRGETAPDGDTAAAVGGVILPPRRRVSKMAKRRMRAQVEKLEADVEGVRVRNAAAAGKLVDPTQWNAEVAALVLMVKARLTAIPEEFRNELPPDLAEDGVRRLRSMIENVLRAMAKWKFSERPDAAE